MPGRSPNSEAGKRLRAVRERLGLSTREVERRSRSAADAKQNQEYYISHAWLSQIERGELAPGIFKIYTLSTIYQLRFDQVLAFFGIRLSDIGSDQIRQPLPLTHLVGASLAAPEAPQLTVTGINLDRTDLVSRMFARFGRFDSELFPRRPSVSSVYGYVGTSDYTLNPLIRPGSFVEIDSSQRKIERSRWGSVFERPIYFIELRENYACSWCEEKDRSLLLIPFPESGCQVREVRYPGDAGIIGRVTAVMMRIAETREKRVGATIQT